MAKRFGKYDVKVGENDKVSGLEVVHRFIYNDQKYYIAVETDGSLVILGA